MLLYRLAISFGIRLKANSLIAMVLLKVLTGEEAQYLNGNSLECVSRRVALLCIENSGTYVFTKDIGMNDFGVTANLRRSEGEIVRNGDAEVDGNLVVGR